MNKVKKKDIIDKYLNPVTVNEDVWFYINPKSIDFVVWAKVGDKRQCVMFRVLKRRLTLPQ